MEYSAQIAILFARKDSIYKQLPGCDVFDIDRDARSFPGGMPVVAHPPCRAWGRLRHFAKPEHDEKLMAIWAISQVREWGGVLEHPASSKLWDELNLPLGKIMDEFGGWTLSIDQHWWGHKARKKTWLYICGVAPSEIPEWPLRFEAVTHVVNSCLRAGKRLPEISKAEREHTPLKLAIWLIELAKKSTITSHPPVAQTEMV